MSDKELLLYLYGLLHLKTHDGFAETLDHIIDKLDKHLNK